MIGTRALSSVMIVKTEAGSGIQVETRISPVVPPGCIVTLL